jgi:3-isopropylmalate/(R)-2-methylmalate dehydratase large subunit
VSQTAVEKILSQHVGQPVRPDELVIVPVDAIMASDATAPYAIRAFEEMGGGELWRPEKVILVIDHAAPAPNQRISNLHRMMRKFAQEKGCRLYDVGAGICHQVMVENRHAQPGEVVIGADSHSCAYGAVGAFATGVGSTDLAALMRTGKTWLKIPTTIRIELTGRLPAGTVAKDVILFLVGQLGLSGASYQAIEYTGEVIEGLPWPACLWKWVRRRASWIPGVSICLTGSNRCGPISKLTMLRCCALTSPTCPRKSVLPIPRIMWFHWRTSRERA